MLPSLKGYVEKNGTLPACLTASLAFYIAFYHGTKLTDAGLIGTRPKGNEYTISDDREVLEFFHAHKDDSAEALTHAVLFPRRLLGHGSDTDPRSGSRRLRGSSVH